MKKILIATDFSLPAENAAKYAVALAADYKASVLIFNAIRVPSDAPMASRIAWPLMDYEALKQQSDSQLDLLVRSLDSRTVDDNQDYFSQDVQFESHRGTLLEVTSLLVKNRNIDMVVMGIAGAGALTQLILGSNARLMIEKAVFPVLFIPFEANYKPIKTIAFATELNPEDIIAIKSILKLVPGKRVRFRIVHITEHEIEPKSTSQLQIDGFLGEIRKEITGANIAYEYVWNIGVDEGLAWIAEQRGIDMIAIVHKYHSFLSRLFNGSHVQKLSRNTRIPLLVLPSTTSSR